MDGKKKKKKSKVKRDLAFLRKKMIRSIIIVLIATRRDFPGGGTHFHNGADKYIVSLAQGIEIGGYGKGCSGCERANSSRRTGVAAMAAGTTNFPWNNVRFVGL
ncbi:unnamed protein product [Arabidopsis arenosa]|uniref:Uncharacterized protein n=1 Tax=Arabidopsis arenosa TaxID=38785 RepID=A0A8S2AMZ3_ARAAE|nr:unnamed protein product [Arabidopsis arenosa]